MKNILFPIFIILFGIFTAKSQTKIPYSGQKNSVNDKPKVFIIPKTSKSKNGQKNSQDLKNTKKGMITISAIDNMPCLMPDGNFNMPVMKIDTATKYAMRIGKIK